MSVIFRWCALVGLVAVLGACVPIEFSAAAEVASPLSPQDALGQFQLDEGLTIELVVCEPDVVDPIAVRFDEAGRLWVVEMRDYPHGPPKGSGPLSRIRVLEDRDGDGRYESAQTFAEGLLFPTGLQPWQGGVIVTLAEQVIYLKDTDGDGHADLRELWYQGFKAENPQLRANHPRFGIDNRVYIANGLRGGTVVDPRRPQQPPLSISGRDFAFDPRSGDCEAVSGNGQFGMAFDDFGNRFVCNNRQPLDHVVLENRYLARNPLLAVPTVLASVAAPGDLSRVHPLTAAWTTSNLHAGQFTAACGIEIFRGDALGPGYVGNSLTCEPTGSLVHRELVKPDGVTFTGTPATPGREFLASRDAWFRPVNLETGPDGALYVVDMYRAVIEHPQYMPSAVQQRPDLRLGDDRGRIYRIVAKNTSRPQPLHLAQADGRKLVGYLGHPNSWVRETAARLLYERQDAETVQPLVDLAARGEQEVARAGALRALEGIGRLEPALIEVALRDVHPRVREQAVILSEQRLAGDENLRGLVACLAQDADSRVAFRMALALGGATTGDVVEPLVQIALSRPSDVWIREAVASALPEQTARIAVAALRSPKLKDAAEDAPELQVIALLANVVSARDDAGEVREVWNVAGALPVESPARAETLLGLADGMRRRGIWLPERLAQTAGPQSEEVKRLEQSLGDARVVAANGQAAEALRLRQLALLQYGRDKATQQTLAELIAHDPSQAIRIAAAKAVHPADAAVSAALLASYVAQGPTVRRAILDALIGTAPSAEVLLAAIEGGTLPRGELDAAREGQLRMHADQAVASHAQKLLVQATAAERKQVLAAYQPALELAPDVPKGKELFRQHCSVCHRIGDLGVNVAPDISDSRVKTQAQLLTDILNPNQAIDNNYVSYTVVTTAGTSHTGVISAETASSITLRQAEDKSVTLLRADIESIHSNGVSLMPEGFEKSLSVQQVADVIGYIKNWRYGASQPGAPPKLGAP